MVDPGQAREQIWQSITALGGPAAVCARMPSGPDGKPPVSVSMLYKWRQESERRLGRDSVNALAPLMPDIAAETWLAAMGVERAPAVVEAAEAQA